MIGRFLMVCLAVCLPVGAICAWLDTGPMLAFNASLATTLLVMTFLIDWVAGD